MKLNPRKYTVEVEEGHFLGYQISKEGIKPNQVKIQELLDFKIPHNIKGVKDINGRLIALGRFVAKSSENALLVFQMLKGFVDKNHFKWTKEADTTLQFLKAALH